MTKHWEINELLEVEWGEIGSNGFMSALNVLMKLKIVVS